jgi:hypothetical protein
MNDVKEGAHAGLDHEWIYYMRCQLLEQAWEAEVRMPYKHMVKFSHHFIAFCMGCK